MRQRTAQGNTGGSFHSFTLPPAMALQRKCACGGDAGFSGDCQDCDEKRFSVQRSARDSATETAAAVPVIVYEVLRSPGEPLDTHTRVFMEQRFGHDFAQISVAAPQLSQSGLTISPANDPLEREADRWADKALDDSAMDAQSRDESAADFSRVRIHTDARAAESSRAVNARAYTVGQDIVFSAGSYAPSTEAGRKLLAHELAHTLQQSRDVSATTARLQRTMGDGHDLQASRFAGDPDLEACFDNEKLLRIGARGPAVEKIQQALIDSGFPLPEFGVDGIFGSETQGAVQRYQRAHGLDPDGIVGPLTMGELDRQFAGGSPAPAPAPTTPTQPGPSPAPTSPPSASESIASETVVALPTPKTRTDIGVGEKVDLTHAPGSATWTTTGGKLNATTGVKVRLTAPDTAQTITVTAGAASIDFKVIAPNDVHMDLSNKNVKHQKFHADSGIATQPFLLPDNVNFSNVSYHELNTGAVVTTPGAYSCLSGRGHCRTKSGGVCPELFMTDNVVAGKGTEAVSFDCIYSGDCQQSAPFTPGSITFAIPWEYQVGSLGFHKFATVDQLSELAADGVTLRSKKIKAEGSTTVDADSATLTECPDTP